jgi:hypothetical protein
MKLWKRVAYTVIPLSLRRLWRRKWMEWETLYAAREEARRSGVE